MGSTHYPCLSVGWHCAIAQIPGTFLQLTHPIIGHHGQFDIADNLTPDNLAPGQFDTGQFETGQFDTGHQFDTADNLTPDNLAPGQFDTTGNLTPRTI